MASSPPVLRFQRGLPQARQFGERLRLLVLQGGDKGTAFCLVGDFLTVGREDCNINLPDSNISKKHAEIHWQNGQYTVHDLGSANGVLLNGKKVNGMALAPGDTLLVGMTVIKILSAGQTNKNEAFKATRVAEAGPEKTKEDRAKENDQTRKKRLVVFLLLAFLLYYAYSNSDDRQTNRGHAAIPMEDIAPPKKASKKEVENAKAALKEFSTKVESEAPERHDADKFFHSGMRELQNKNYRRAINAFETALSVDPNYDLSKIYLGIARKQMQEEIKSDFNAGVMAKKSLRYKEARIYYESILRLLDADKTDPMYDKTQKEIEDVDKMENEQK